MLAKVKMQSFMHELDMLFHTHAHDLKCSENTPTWVVSAHKLLLLFYSNNSTGDDINCGTDSLGFILCMRNQYSVYFIRS